MKLWCRCTLAVALLAAPAVAFGQCPGDINGDGAVDLGDLAILLAAYDQCDGDPYYNPDADLNDDDCVDLSDLAILLSVYGTTCPDAFTETQLAGNSLSEYPYFEYVRAFNDDATVEVAIDPTRFPDILGETADIYVVEAKSEAQWGIDPSLTDATGSALSVSFGGSTIQDNTFTVANPFELDADAGIGLGVAYDVVIDMDQNGELSAGDLIDGLSGEPGLFACADTNDPGPLAVTEIVYTGGTWLGQDTHYPTDIASMGQLPLIIISHGNGHNYRWYNHIQNHFASRGYIVMSHQNNTGPGVFYASTTTLTNTDYILANQGTISGGVLDGHIDSHRIVWIGHSRGGEGIAIAYDRIYDGTWTPTHYTRDDLVLLDSMLPVDFLKGGQSNPHDANYHLWTAAGDSDVNGSASCDLCQTFHLHTRAERFRGSTVVQGTGHGWFHDYDPGGDYFTGPCPIYESGTHLVQLGYMLPLVLHYTKGNVPAIDYFWRQYESFHPPSVPVETNPCFVVTNEYRNGAEVGNFMIDDYQSQTGTSTSSSGGAVTYNVTNLTEGRLDDNNTSFAWTPSDPFNGATQDSASDNRRGVVFDWNGSNRYYEWAVVAAGRDFTPYSYLSVTGAQGTQHPYTLAFLGDETFSITLRDGSGTSSTIHIGAYGGGLEQPYQRQGGWHNEMETIRIRPTDFLTNGSGLDLTDIAAVRLDVGPSYGSNEGRIVIDELMLTTDPMP